MGRQGRRNNRKKVAAPAPALPVTNGPTNDPSLESTDALEPAQPVPAQTAPILPIEVIQMIAELLVDDGKEAWRALVAMSRLSRDFRTASLPVLVRDVDVTAHDQARVIKLLQQLFESVLRHVRSAKLDFGTSKKLNSLFHGLLKQVGPNLRSLSVQMRASPIGPKTAKILNAAVSEKLESLDIIYVPDNFGRPAPSTMPERLQIPSSVKKIAFQFLAEGNKIEDAIEKQIWRTVAKLPNLREWSFTVDPNTRSGTNVSLEGFPSNKAALLSEISRPPFILSNLAEATGLTPRSVHVWVRQSWSSWKDFHNWALFAAMTSITRLTLEKVELNAPLLLNLPTNLEELFLLDANIVGAVWNTTNLRYEPYTQNAPNGFVGALGQLPCLRILYFRGFGFAGWYFYTPGVFQELLQVQIAFWQRLLAPFTVIVER